MTNTEVLSEQLSKGEVGQSDSDVSFPSQSKDWLYTETELWPLVTFRVSDPFLATSSYFNFVENVETSVEFIIYVLSAIKAFG